jgi:cellulose synthase/poly-beta-1,6-N-acetylglucosamine synthase-like glycosyltransferase
MTEILLWIAETIGYLLIGYFILLNISYLVQGLLSVQLLKRYYQHLRVSDMDRFRQEQELPPVTLIIPAYNEETNLQDTLRNLEHQDYPDYEILIVNDGSTDKMLSSMIKKYALEPAFHLNPNHLKTAPVKEVYRSKTHPHIWIIDKKNSGKADSLNAALNYCQTPFFCVMDADTILEPYALSRMMFTFLTERDTVAVGGILRVMNGCELKDGKIETVKMPKNSLAALQVLEYMRSFLASRMSWNLARGSLIISGAFGMFSHATVVNAGGYATNTVGEDMELVVRLHRYCRQNKRNYHIRFVPDPVAWTQCPESLSDLYLQRERWQRGLVQSLVKHLPMLLNPRFGSVGLLGMPFFFFLEMLGPIIEVLGYFALLILVLAGKFSWVYGLVLFGVSFGMGMLVSIVSIILSELNTRRFHETSSLWQLLGWAILENLGYRQLMSFWRVGGTLAAFSGKTHWGRIQRQPYENSETIQQTVSQSAQARLDSSRL